MQLILVIYNNSLMKEPYPYEGHIIEWRDKYMKQTMEEKSRFYFVDAEITLEQRHDIENGLNKWRWNFEISSLELLPEEYWVIPAEQVL